MDSHLVTGGDAAQQTAEALHYLQEKVPQQLRRPVVGIICGTGLDGVADRVLPESRLEISYADIPHFPISTGMRVAMQVSCNIGSWSFNSTRARW